MTIKPRFKIDTMLLFGATVLLLGAMVLMVLRLLDQSETHVKAVKDMKVEFVNTQFQPDISTTTEGIQADLKADPNRTTAKYRNLILNKQSFKAISKMKKLTTLELDDCEYDPKLLRYLEELPVLQYLDISGSDIVDEDLEAVGNIKTLTAVKLSDTKCSGKGLAYLNGCKKLQLIEVTGLMIQDEDLKAIEGLPLDNLNVSGTQLTNAACDSLSKLVTLTRLDVSRTKIDGVGLARLKTLVNLNYLAMNDCDIKDSDLHLFAQLPALTELRLRTCPITNKGIMELAKSRTLMVVHLVNCSEITQSGVANLRKADKRITVELGSEATGFSRYKNMYLPE